MKTMVSNQEAVFHSSDLKQAWQSALPYLEGVNDLRSRASADIKALETRLKGLPCQDPFRLFVGQSSDSSEIETLVAKLPSNYEQKHPLLIDEFLLLDLDPHGNTRLLFERSLAEHPGYQGSHDVFYYQPGVSRYRESKPLIEQKSAIRLQLYPKLPEFLLALAEARRTGRHAGHPKAC